MEPQIRKIICKKTQTNAQVKYLDLRIYVNIQKIGMFGGGICAICGIYATLHTVKIKTQKQNTTHSQDSSVVFRWE